MAGSKDQGKQSGSSLPFALMAINILVLAAFVSVVTAGTGRVGDKIRTEFASLNVKIDHLTVSSKATGNVPPQEKKLLQAALSNSELAPVLSRAADIIDVISRSGYPVVDWQYIDFDGMRGTYRIESWGPADDSDDLVLVNFECDCPPAEPDEGGAECVCTPFPRRLTLPKP